MKENKSSVDDKLILMLQSQIPGLVKNITSYLQNPSGDEDPNKVLIQDDKIKNEFFQAEQSKPFQQIIEKMLLHSLLTCAENPIQAQYQVGKEETQKVYDNWEMKSEIFRAACNPVFDVEWPEQEGEFDKVIKIMTEKISANPEKQITNEQEYQDLRERLDKTHDLTNLPDRELGQEDQKIKYESKMRISKFKKPKSPDSKFQTAEELEAEIEAILYGEKQEKKMKL